MSALLTSYPLRALMALPWVRPAGQYSRATAFPAGGGGYGPTAVPRVGTWKSRVQVGPPPLRPLSPRVHRVGVVRCRRGRLRALHRPALFGCAFFFFSTLPHYDLVSVRQATLDG